MSIPHSLSIVSKKFRNILPDNHLIGLSKSTSAILENYGSSAELLRSDVDWLQDLQRHLGF
jgi:hypothetical protein